MSRPTFWSLSFVVLLTLITLSEAQSAAQCVSSPGVDLRLLTACEQLQTQLSRQITAGGTVNLQTAVTYEIPPTPASGNSAATSAPGTAVLQTSAVATSGSGGFGGPGGVSSTTQGGTLGSGTLGTGSSAASSGTEGGGGGGGGGGGILGSSAPTSSGAASGASQNGQPASSTASGGASSTGSSTGSATAGQANSQSTNGSGLSQSSTSSDSHHYRNTVVIPVAVVCTVVPVLLLALLACCLIRRRRKRGATGTALLADAENEKYDSWHSANGVNGANGASEASAMGGAAAGTGTAAGAATRSRPTNTAAVGSSPANQSATPAAPSAPHTGTPHHTETGKAAELGASAVAGAGAAGLAAQHHSKNPSNAPSTTSAYSSHNNFHGFSGAGTPAHSSPMSTTNNFQQSPSATHGAAALGTGGTVFGLGNASHSRPNRSGNGPPGTASTTRSERAPTLPEMDPAMGSGTWFAGEYDDPKNRDSVPQDPASVSEARDSDYGVPREDLSDRYGSGVRSNHASTNYSRPSAPSQSFTPETMSPPPHATYAAAEDPFVTPPTSTAESARASHDHGIVSSAPQRSPEHPVQQQPQLVSRSDSGSKAARVLGMDAGSGSTSQSPVQTGSTGQIAPMSTNTASTAGDSSLQYVPSSAVGEVRQGPYTGASYQGPQIGPDVEHSQAGQRVHQVTSYPSENEARAFDFGSGRQSAEEQHYNVPRKPVGGS